MSVPILSQTANIFTNSNEIMSKPSNEYGVTMTSLELVQFINNQRDVGAAELAHSDFLKKVPQVLGGGLGNFSDTYVHAQNGQTYPCYRFPKREACLMAMSYSYDLQAKVFDRMTALEASAPVFAIPTTLSAAPRLAADQSEKIEEQKVQLAIAAPKVAALDLIATADGMLNLQAAGKALQQQPNKFIQLLREKGWIYKRPGSTKNCARAEKFNAGYLTTKAHTVIQSDGTERVREQVMVTPKGLAKLAEMFSQ